MPAKNYSVPASQLKLRTKKMLVERSRLITFPQIKEATGISIGFLDAFANGRVESPNVDFVVALYEYLANKQLRV